MSAYNVVIACDEEECPRCGSKTERRIQVKYADTWQYEYKKGDRIRWGGNKRRTKPMTSLSGTTWSSAFVHRMGPTTMPGAVQITLSSNHDSNILVSSAQSVTIPRRARPFAFHSIGEIYADFE